MRYKYGMDTNDKADQERALSLGWAVCRVSLYDEEGVDGWQWTEPDGTDHAEMGDWDDPPPWPDSARKALAEKYPK
jgi:hypothetical protein